MSILRPFFFFLSLFAGLTTVAQRLHPLIGIWQQEITASNGHFIRIPVWKIMAGDGTFSIIMMTDKTCHTVQTLDGRYTISSDSTYTEQVKTNIIHPTQNNAVNLLNYKFQTPDNLIISYQLQGNSHRVQERWRRIKLENPMNRRNNGPDKADLAY